MLIDSPALPTSVRVPTLSPLFLASTATRGSPLPTMASRATGSTAAATIWRAVRGRGVGRPLPPPSSLSRTIANAACMPALLGRADPWAGQHSASLSTVPAVEASAAAAAAASAAPPPPPPRSPAPSSHLLNAAAGGLGTDARMAAVSQLVDGRSAPHVIGPDASVTDAVRKMVDLNTGSLLVVSPVGGADAPTLEGPPSSAPSGSPQRIATGGDAGDGVGLRLEGIITERDYLTMSLSGRSPDTTRVADVMSRQVITVSADATVGDCMRIMSASHIRHLPVLEGPPGAGGELLGLVSMRDVVGALAEDHERTLAYLHTQITRLANVAHVGGGGHHPHSPGLGGGVGTASGGSSMASASPGGCAAGWRQWFSG